MKGRNRRQPGLRLRMGSEARRISDQHRQLDSFYAQVVAALEEGSIAQARLDFERFSDALDAHLTLEEQIYFPALHGLRPSLGDRLTSLVDEHARFREGLQQVEQLLMTADLTSIAEQLEALVSALSRHELCEEELLEEITGGS